MCQTVHILDQNIHRNKRTDSANQRSDKQPEQNRGSVLRALQTVARCILCDSVSKTVILEQGINTAGNIGQQNELNQSGCVLTVSRTHNIHILSQFINEVIAVDTAGNDTEQNVHQ